MILFYLLPCGFTIFINVFAFLFVLAISKETCEETSFATLHQKNADVSIFVGIQGRLSCKNVWLPQFLFVDSKSPCKGLLFPHSPNLVQKLLYLVDTVLKL